MNILSYFCQRWVIQQTPHIDPVSIRCWVTVCDAGPALIQHKSMSLVCLECILRIFPANTKKLRNICAMLDQRRRRWADVVQMLYTCFVFAWLRYQYLGFAFKHHTIVKYPLSTSRTKYSSLPWTNDYWKWHSCHMTGSAANHRSSCRCVNKCRMFFYK